MPTNTKISIDISKETKAQMEAFIKSHRVKKAYLIEEALQHFPQALREIPEDLIIPARLVLSAEAMERIAEQIAAEGKPTEDLKALFRG